MLKSGDGAAGGEVRPRRGARPGAARRFFFFFFFFLEARPGGGGGVAAVLGRVRHDAEIAPAARRPPP